MRKLGLTLLLATLAVLLAVGCADDYPKPNISHLTATESCGVGPLRVDFRAETSGGKPFSEPTGGNSWLKMSWDFGDGNRIENGTSVAYHVYDPVDAAKVYTVTVTTQDDLGETASSSIEITVNPDTLTITPYAEVLEQQHVFEVSVSACTPMTLGYLAKTCGFDEVWDSYDRFVTRWALADSTLPGFAPQWTFWPEHATMDTSFFFSLLVEDPGQSIFRPDTLWVLNIRFDDEDRTDLSLSADWLQTADPDDPDYQGDYDGGETFTVPANQRPLSADDMPVYFTYSIRLKNDGLASAYNLALTGELHGPGDDRYAVLESADTSIGSFLYSSTEKRWDWHISELPPDSEELLHITFSNRAHPPTAARWPNPMNFTASIINAPYPCDVEQDGQNPKWSTQAVLQRDW